MWLSASPIPKLIAEARRLKWIHVSSSGITRYDTKEFRALAAERKIMLSNSASVYNEACAAHVFSFMLAQARVVADRHSRPELPAAASAWHAVRSACRTLRGETVLIVGYGAIGKRLAELLRPFDMKITGYRRKPRGDEGLPVISRGPIGRHAG